MGSRAVLALALVVVLVGGITLWLMEDGGGAVDTDTITPAERVETPDIPATTAGDGQAAPLVTGVDEQPEQIEIEQPLVDLDLLEDATVYGLVTFEDGSPAPDIDVQLFDHAGEFFDSTFTEDDGTYVLEAGEPLGAGWSVMTESPDYEETDKLYALGPSVHRHPTAHAPGQPPVRVDLEVLQAPRINGRVFDALTGEAIELAEISVVSTKPGWIDEWQDQFTDEGGYYEMSITNLPPDGLLVWCYGDDQQPGAVGPLELLPGQTYTYDFSLPPVRSLTGVVLDRLTLDPIGDADVMVLPLHPEYEDPDGWDSTFDDGTFEIEPTETPFDMMTLYVRHLDYGPVIVPPPAGGWGSEVEILMPPARTLKGTVLSAAGRAPVDGALVTAMLTTVSGLLFEDELDEELCEEDGTFEVVLENVAPSQGVVMVSADGFYPFRADLEDLVGGSGDWTERTVTIVLDPLPEE